MKKIKLKFKTTLAGPGIWIKPGQIAELPEKEAMRHIAAGNAVLAPEEAPARKGRGKNPLINLR